MSADLGTLPQSQSGVALIIGLVLLITLTILGIGTLSTTSLEQRMAGNMGDLNLAFNAAETAGQCYANIIAKSSTFPRTKNMANGWWDDAAYDNDWWKSTKTVASCVPVPKVGSQPRIVVEDAGLFQPHTLTIGHSNTSNGIEYLRLTTSGTGYSNNTQVILRHVIAKTN